MLIKEFPRISLIIPARGDEIMLSDTINNSIAQANGFPIEVIIIDNGLTNKIIIVAGGPVKMIKLENARGCGIARHKGVEDARGQIIVTIDAHVRLGFDWASEVYKAMSENGIDDAIYCGHVGHLGDDFTPADQPCYHGAEFHWVDPGTSDFRPLAALWYRGDNTTGERGAIMGAYYAFSKACYQEIGSPWSLTNGWGCDEEMLSLAAVCSQKKIMMLPLTCSSWHWFGCARISYSDVDIVAIIETRLRIASLFPFSAAARKELCALPLQTKEQIEFANMYASAYELLDQHLMRWCKGYAEFLKRQDNAIEIDEKYLIPII